MGGAGGGGHRGGHSAGRHAPRRMPAPSHAGAKRRIMNARDRQHSNVLHHVPTPRKRTPMHHSKPAPHHVAHLHAAPQSSESEADQYEW